MISAKVIRHSINKDITMENGKHPEIMTQVVTFPRIILAEFNTHRMFSRNSASSRAIPFKKMIRSVKENPFIPVAWQKDHTGMQGTEYFSKTEKFDITDFIIALNKLFDNDSELIKAFSEILEGWKGITKTLDEWWITARDLALEASILLSCFGVTKQLCNRLLEPFMWHTVIVTATEWKNFFALRCPQYSLGDGDNGFKIFRSKKDAIKTMPDLLEEGIKAKPISDSDWLVVNKGQAEIHMMALAEAMWDAYNESAPKELKAGEWHIPFGDNIDDNKLEDLLRGPFKASYIRHDGDKNQAKIEIATARCARISYTVIGEEDKSSNYENDIKLHDRLNSSGHWSPFEHCARAMSSLEYYENVKGIIPTMQEENGDIFNAETYCTGEYASTLSKESYGWSNNIRGFIQYRKMIEENDKKI